MFPFPFRRRLLLSTVPSRHLSKSTSIPKKLERVRDHGFDDVMETEKKVRRYLRLRDLILSHPTSSLPFSRLDALARRYLSFRPHETGAFLLRHPHAFHIFDHPFQRLLWVRLTPHSLSQRDLELSAVSSLLPNAVHTLRKLIRLSTPLFRLRLEHIRLFRRDLGLPDDYECSVILANPQFFRLVGDPCSKYVEAVLHPDDEPELNQCAIEHARVMEYRNRGTDMADARFSFIVNFPPGFKIGKFYRIAMWKWQRVPYWSPYEDVSGYDLRSLEARKRMEKRAVAMIHEMLSLTVEKRTTLERIAFFREEMGLPKKLKEFLLRHQGIFYISTRGNQGKLHTVFLREAYRKGELLEPNDIYLARRKLNDLLLMSPKKANVDRMLTSLGRSADGFGASRRKFRDRDGDGDCGDDEEDSGSDSGVDSQVMD